jgi:vacuolar-type H+-ATPase subunit F/Vma7
MNRLLFLLPVLFLACGTRPETVNGALQAAVKEPEEEPAAIMPVKEELAAERPAETEPAAGTQNVPVVVVVKNSVDLSQESYEEVLDEVKAFVDDLNQTIKNKNYYKWRSVLSEELLNDISSPEFLANASKWPSMKSRGIVLREPRDYFNYVVVPSRANSQVDKIEIMDNNRVKAFYINTRKERTELVYELAKIGDSWTIIR